MSSFVREFVNHHVVAVARHLGVLPRHDDRPRPRLLARGGFAHIQYNPILVLDDPGNDKSAGIDDDAHPTAVRRQPHPRMGRQAWAANGEEEAIVEFQPAGRAEFLSARKAATTPEAVFSSRSRWAGRADRPESLPRGNLEGWPGRSAEKKIEDSHQWRVSTRFRRI